MRIPILPRLEKARRSHPMRGTTPVGATYGYFEINGLRIISSGDKRQGDDESELYQWEHVSVSLPNRIPTWTEMCFVKELFWDDSETVLQFHPPKSEYVNDMPFCLHLWKKSGVNAELPPMECV